MNVLYILTKIMMITMEFDEIKPVEVISSKIRRNIVKRNK